MKRLRYISVQPRLLYFAWQVEVMLNNFIKQGINPNNIDVLVATNPNDATSNKQNVEAFNRLANHFNSVRFFFYEDTREQPIHYVSSIRPNILKQHFKAHPEIKEDILFYHDCDMLFTKPPSKILEPFIEKDIWYVSDTNSYINYDYIISKGEDVYSKMCQVTGMMHYIPKLMNSNSGGAQYILKNTDERFWDKVERDSENLFKEISELNNIKKLENSNYHELQIFCADMWAVLWNAWLRGYETKVVPELDFTWPTEPVNYWEKSLVFHNAGVTCAYNKVFYKALYMDKTPYNIKLNQFNKDKNTYNYVKEIVETAKKSCLKGI